MTIYILWANEKPELIVGKCDHAKMGARPAGRTISPEDLEPIYQVPNPTSVIGLTNARLYIQRIWGCLEEAKRGTVSHVFEAPFSG